MPVLIIDRDGDARTIHDDATMPIMRALGEVWIARASHVEPLEGGMWSADLAPVRGPILGPFETRAEALSAERAWLMEHNIPEVMT